MTLIKYPKITYRPRLVTIDATNNKIDFEETAATPLVATVASGLYSIGELRFQIVKALEAAGASSYTVTYSYSTNFMTIKSNGAGGGGILELNWSSGPNSANSIGPTLGYDVSDLTGALTYTATNKSPVETTFTFTQPTRMPKFRTRGRQKTLTAAGGSNETTFLRNDRSFGFNMEFIEQDDLGEWVDFAETCFLAGGQFDYYPDNTDNASHIALIGDDNKFAPREMVRRGLIGFWKFTMNCRVVESLINTPQGSSTITYQQLMDRVNV